MAIASRRRAGRRIALVVTAGVVVALAAAPAAFAADPTVTFVSDTTWTVTDEDAAIGPSLSLPGAAQNVCLNASAPTPCPAGATEYGWPGGGWDVNLSGIPGATWIWAPGITKDSTPADNDTYRFTRTVDVPGTPTGGTASLAADDGATLWVNGTKVGSTAGPAQMSTFDIGSQLVKGKNTIVVVAANGPICGEACAYQRNPGGVVFGGSISYSAAAPTAAPTNRPHVTTPPTSTVNPAATPDATPGLAWVLLGIGAAVAASATLSRRAGRRQR